MSKLFLIIIMLFPVCYASECDSTHNECLAYQSTQEQVECLIAETACWDSLLNINYKLLMKLLTDIEKDKLRIAQRNWITFKEKEIDFLDQLFSWNPKTKGTIVKLYRVKHIMELTKSRALVLKEYYQSIEDSTK